MKFGKIYASKYLIVLLIYIYFKIHTYMLCLSSKITFIYYIYTWKKILSYCIVQISVYFQSLDFQLCSLASFVKKNITG